MGGLTQVEDGNSNALAGLFTQLPLIEGVVTV